MAPENANIPEKPRGVDHQRLKSLINNMGDGVIAIDENQNIVLYNGAALNILDSNAGMEGKPIASVMQLMTKQNQQVDLKQLISQIKVPYYSRDFKLVYADKTNISLYLSIAPVKLGYGTQGDKGYVIMVRDITREKSLEEERDEFISVVSHELRTPITIAEGNVSNAQLILKNDGEHNKIEEALKLAHDQIVFLSGMINDLSTLSRAERGKLEVQPEDINVHELVNDLQKTYLPDAEKKGLQLKAEVDPHLELLRSSKLYVREILQNFVTNAIKYTEKGSVTIGAKANQDGVRFYVADTGIGISKQDKEKVFDKFFRSEDFRTRQNSGTGLGLYVTMKLIRLIKAGVRVDSEVNKGSVFYVDVPNIKTD